MGIVFGLAGATAGLLAGIRIHGKKKNQDLPRIVRIILTSDEIAGTCCAALSEGCTGCVEGGLRGVET
jgi:hypothetical protein